LVDDGFLVVKDLYGISLGDPDKRQRVEAALGPYPDLLRDFQRRATGLRAEDEFIALSAWSGRCTLIHKLDQEQYPSSSRIQYQVPDLFAVFTLGTNRVPLLIEVKEHTKEVTPPQDIRLKLSSKKWKGLKAYGEAHGLPVAIAWKLRELGLWCLFDLETMERAQSAFHAKWPGIYVNDLKGVLLGDLSVQIAEGSKWVMKIQRLAPEKGGKFPGKVEASYVAGPAGIPFVGKGPVLSLLSFCDDDVRNFEDGNVITQEIFVVRDQWLFTHWLLYRAIEEESQVDWIEILRRGKFSFTFGDVDKTIQKAGEAGIVKTIVHYWPNSLPSWLPDIRPHVDAQNKAKGGGSGGSEPSGIM